MTAAALLFLLLMLIVSMSFLTAAKYLAWKAKLQEAADAAALAGAMHTEPMEDLTVWSGVFTCPPKSACFWLSPPAPKTVDGPAATVGTTVIRDLQCGAYLSVWSQIVCNLQPSTATLPQDPTQTPLPPPLWGAQPWCDVGSGAVAAAQDAFANDTATLRGNGAQAGATAEIEPKPGCVVMVHASLPVTWPVTGWHSTIGATSYAGARQRP